MDWVKPSYLYENLPNPVFCEPLLLLLQRVEMFRQRHSLDQLHHNVQLVAWSEWLTFVLLLRLRQLGAKKGPERSTALTFKKSLVIFNNVWVHHLEEEEGAHERDTRLYDSGTSLSRFSTIKAETSCLFFDDRELRDDFLHVIVSGLLVFAECRIMEIHLLQGQEVLANLLSHLSSRICVGKVKITLIVTHLSVWTSTFDPSPGGSSDQPCHAQGSMVI